MNWTSLFVAVSLTIAISTTGALAQSSPSSASTELQALEKRFFMHDFSKEPIDSRLTRMEKFTFGQEEKGTTQTRLSHLAEVLENHSPDTKIMSVHNPQAQASQPKVAQKPQTQTKTPPVAAPPVEQPSPAQEDSDDGTTEYPHISYLETEILGQAFEGQPLSARLARLESKTFGMPSRSDDLSSRTDALEKYAEQTLHKKPFSLRPDDDDDSDRPINSIRSLRSLFQNRAPVADASASSPTPPPESARLLSRVEWCEMHTFHRTYPELHLLERLHQLKTSVLPNDHEKDIELMDHVDMIVKEVVLRQHPPQTAQL